jgi:hypothetical protein
MTVEDQLDCRNQALGMIIDIGLDYDGYNSIETLKSLIDELVGFAKDGLNNKFPQYIGKGSVKEFHNSKMVEIPENEWSEETIRWMRLFNKDSVVHNKGT